MRRGPKPQPIKGRFWQKVSRTGPDKCWPWRGSVNSTGYGYVSVSGRVVGAHHVAWVLEHGPIPSQLCVCHRCDNPRCCNPAHLFLATHEENMDDMRNKGRNRPPPRRSAALSHDPTADLSSDQIQVIQDILRAHRGSVVGIARQLGVKRSAVDAIWWELEDEKDRIAKGLKVKVGELVR